MTLSLIFLFLAPLFAVMGAISTLPAEAEAKFIVYPDGTVGLTGKGNVTGMFQTSSSTIHMDAQLSKEAGTQKASVNTTMTLPPEQASQFPLNATSVSMANEYSNGLETSGINASVTLPNTSNMQGMGIDFTGFPFNTTDFTLSGEYANQSFNGTLTVHLVPGLTLGDIHVNLRGNLTGMTLNDSIMVFYNYTLPIPGFPNLNQTYLTQLLQMLTITIPGEGLGSLYNMTMGMFKCTDFNTTITPIDQNSARISFSAAFQGDLIQLLTSICTSYLSQSGSTPFGPYIGPLPTKALNSTIYSMLNATCYAANGAQLTMSYSKASRRLDVQAAATMNRTELLNATAKAVQEMQGTYPPQMLPYIQSMYDTTFCSVKSFSGTMSYNNGQLRSGSNYVLEGDLNAEINHVKNVYIDMMNVTAGIPSEMISVMKESDLDVSDLEVSLEVKNDSAVWSLENVKVTPPTDPINATCFKLRRFFNLISSPSEPPGQNERLKLTVQGGSNGTHSVTLFIDPNDPERPIAPDEFAGGNTMKWNNMSISKLKGLIFKVWEGSAETIHTPTSITQAAPLTINAKETAGCTLTLTSISKPATISVKNTTSADTGPTPATYKMLGSYVQVTTDPGDLTVNLTMCIYYTPEQLSALGLSENDLKIFYWDATTSSWTAAETHLNTVEHYAWTVINHLSTWVIMGQPAQALWGQTWFIAAIVAVVAAIVIIVAALVLRRRRLPPMETKDSEAPPQ